MAFRQLRLGKTMPSMSFSEQNNLPDPNNVSLLPQATATAGEAAVRDSESSKRASKRPRTSDEV